MLVDKVVKHIKRKTPLKDMFQMAVIQADKYLLASRLNFKTYYAIQKQLGFPVQKMNFYIKNRYSPDLKAPKSFNEKCTYLKLFSRNPLLPIISDKYKVREYVSKRIGNDILIPLLQVAKHPKDINIDTLPTQFVIKTNFASGQNIIIKNAANIDWKDISEKLTDWLNIKYRTQELIWFAQEIERKIIIEQLLKDQYGQIPSDLKFYVFRGEVKLINIITDRFINKKMTFLDKKWRTLDVTKNRCDSDKSLVEPNNLRDMIYIAELLGKDFDFIRVDLFTVDSKIYFGELTAYPGDGRSKFEPTSFDYELGSYWDMGLSHITSG